MPPLTLLAVLIRTPIALKIFDEVGIIAAILLAITGMALHGYMPRHRISVEERMKDGKLSEDEGRRQIRFYRWFAPGATVLGVLVLLLVLFDLSR